MNIVIVDDQTSARTMLRHVIEDIAPELSVRVQDDFPSGTQRYGGGRRQRATIATNGVRKKEYAGS
ncbi:hypothetical protein, partial [Stenotrophomonas sp. 3diitr2024]|uniref:hypothetical protein n=1 Tax=Stenotrophomonas sp. 3diitr2024 TaxID=3345115 RepID=UPI0035CB59D2